LVVVAVVVIPVGGIYGGSVKEGGIAVG